MPEKHLRNLIDKDGKIPFGLIDRPVNMIDTRLYVHRSPMGLKIPKLIKGLLEKRFMFIGIAGEDVIAGLAFIDLKYLSSAFFYVYDRKEKRMIDRKKISNPFAVDIKPHPETPEGRFVSSRLRMALKQGRIHAVSSGAVLEAELQMKDTVPIRICTRSGYRGWVYTQKTAPIPLRGKITFDGKSIDVSSPGHMAVMDWTTGFMRRDTYWNWASSAAVLPDGKSFGLNLSCGVNETGFTENAFWIDGRMHKVDTVNFEFDPNDLLSPWRIKSFDGKVDLEFTPEANRTEHANALVIASRFTQSPGVFNGKVVTGAGTVETIQNSPGWTEDHFTRW